MRVEYGGSGPSSKVMTTSLSLSGSYSRYWRPPSRLCSDGSTTSVRLVPNASGFPGHSDADAGTTKIDAANRQQDTTALRMRPVSPRPKISTARRATRTTVVALY